MATRRQAGDDQGVLTPDAAPRRREQLTGPVEAGWILGLQRSAGNAALTAALAGRLGRPGGLRPRMPSVQRCCGGGPMAMLSADLAGDVADEATGAAGPTSARPTSASVQRWPFDDEEQAEPGGESGQGSSGGVMDWLGEQAGAVGEAVSGAAGAVSDTVSGAAGAVADTVTDTAAGVSGAVGGAVDAVSGAVSGAVDTVTDAVTDTAGGAVDAVTDAAGGAVDWAKEQGGAAIDAVTAAARSMLEGRRLALVGQLASARARLAGLGALAVSPEQLAALNGHLASVGASSGGRISAAGVASQESAETGGATVSAGALDGMLAGLQSAISTSVIPAGEAAPAAQRSVQRYAMDPQTAAAMAAAAAAAAEAVEVGAVPAAVLAPESAGISLAVLAVIALIIAIVVAIIVYASYRKKEPEPDADPKPETGPEMPPGLSREKKEKWKKCQALYETYKQGTGKEVSQLATEIKEMRAKYDSLTAEQKRELCAKVHQQLELVQQLINDRQRYIDTGCDEFDWFKQGTTEAERRAKHLGEVDNVRAQLANLRALLHKLESDGVC